MFVALRRIQVAVSDFARSRRFYGETIGLSEIGGFEKDWVEFGLGPVILKLTPLRPGEVPSRNQVAVVLSTEALDVTVAALKERGVTVSRSPTDEFTGRSAEILDPDGYRVVVFQPSELHPDEEWIPSSRVEETVKERLNLWRMKEKARAAKETGKNPAARPAKAAKKAVSKKPVPKKTPPAKKPAEKRKG